MSTYRKIHGRSIQAVTTDPTGDVAEGQVWYNTTSDTFKSVVALEAFSSSAPVLKNTYRAGSAGIQTAALLFGGSTASPFTFFADTQEYNGSGFSSSGALAQARWGLRGAGTQTAGLGFAGYIGPPGPPSKNSALTEEYDGTSWTSGGAMGTGRYALGGAGSQTSALAFGGHIYPTSPGNQTANEEYDGSSWTAGGALPSARTRLSGCGPSNNDALAVGHQTSGVCSTYNGTAWTDTGSLGTARYRGGSSGSTSSAITYGGSTHPGVNNVTATENFDGSSWSTSPATMGTARYAFGYAGVVDSALAMSGYTTALTGITEEYNKSVNVITAGAWSSGGNLNTGRYSLQGFGATHDTAVAFTGRATPIYNKTEEYNGTSWTEVNNYPQSVNDAAGCGVLTAGLGLGGLYPSDTSTWPTTGRLTAEYDGTNWTSGGSYTYNAWGTGMAGTQTAAIASGGHNYPMPPGNRNDSAEYDGSSWTAGNNMSQVRAIFSAGGSQTASFACGGRSSPGVEDPTNATEEYDGTNWTSGGNYIISVKENSAGGGPQTAGYVAGGAVPSATAICGFYDGTAWSTAPSLPGAQQLNASTTNNTSNSGAMSFGGGTDNDATYEFTAETTSVNVKTLTQS